MSDSPHARFATTLIRHVTDRNSRTRSSDQSDPEIRTRQVEAQARAVSPGGFAALLTSAFILMFGVAWIYVATIPEAFLNLDYTYRVAKQSLMDTCQLRPVAVFGDSRTMASTLPNVMSVPVTNLAMRSTTPIETYFAVARALRCPNPPKLVVISHVPLFFMADPEYWSFSVKLGLLDYAAMRMVDADAARLGDREIENLQNDGLPLVLREKLFAWHFPSFYFDSLIHGFIAGRLMLNRAGMRDILQSSGHALVGKASGSSEISPEGHASSYKPSPLVDLYFSRTLDLLEKRNVPVVFLTMPVNHATFTHIRPEFREQFAAYLRDKATQHRGLRVIGPTIPCWPDEFFGDVAHFNARGAEDYSRELDLRLYQAMTGSELDELPDRCKAGQWEISEAPAGFAAPVPAGQEIR